MQVTSGLRPAKPWGWVIGVVQTFLRLDLILRYWVRIGPTDLYVLGDLPAEMGLILTSNHAS